MKAYGAVGNGTTVDTTAVQNCVNAALAAGGGIVYFPAGTYVISNVTFGSSLIVEGAGQQGASGTGPTASGGTVLLLDPAQKVTNGSNVVVCRVSPASTTNYTSFFVMRDLTIDGNKTQWASSDTSTQKVFGFYCGQGPGLTDPVTYATMQNVTIQNCRTYGFDVENAGNVTLINCVAANNGYVTGGGAAQNADGFTLIGNDITVIGCQSYGNANRGYLGGQSATTYSRVELQGCEAWGNGSHGALLGSGTGFFLYGAKITGGSFYGNGTSGTGAGIELTTNCTSSAVTGAYCAANASQGIIATGGSYNAITGNTCTGNASNGIAVSGGSYCTVTGNSLSANSTASSTEPEIYLYTSSTYCSVTGNSVNGTVAAHAIAEQSGGGTDYNLITGNTATSVSSPPVVTAGTHTFASANTGSAAPAIELVPAIRTSGPVTLTAGGELSACDTTTGPFTINLPSAPAEGTQYGAKLVGQAGTNAVTIASAGTDRFNYTGGPVTLTLQFLNQGITLQYHAGSPGIWYVLGDDFPQTALDGRYALAPSVHTGSFPAGTGQFAGCDASSGSLTATLP